MTTTINATAGNSTDISVTTGTGTIINVTATTSLTSGYQPQTPLFYSGSACDGSDGELSRTLELGSGVPYYETIFIDGMGLTPVIDYSISGSVITFSGVRVFDTQKINVMYFQ